jgi:hypothetical protein
MPSSRVGMGAAPYAGGTTFRVWAPNALGAAVTGDFTSWSAAGAALASEPGGTGMWSADVPGARPDQAYQILLSTGGGRAPGGSASTATGTVTTPGSATGPATTPPPTARHRTACRSPARWGWGLTRPSSCRKTLRKLPEQPIRLWCLAASAGLPHEHAHYPAAHGPRLARGLPACQPGRRQFTGTSRPRSSSRRSIDS